MAVEALGKRLLGFVANNDIKAVESVLSSGDPATLKEAVKVPFGILSLLEYTLKETPIAAKLLCYEINTISAFHLAALLGQSDTIIMILDKDIPVDMPLDSRSTALHLAAFAGKLDTVRMLLNVYGANVNAQDRYGWTALHYSATEGHLPVIQTLIETHNADISLRDKDGTSPAWRAKVNKHEEVVTYLCKLGDEDELLNIELEETEQEAVDALYSKVNKTKPQANSPRAPNDRHSVSVSSDIDDIMADYAWVDEYRQVHVDAPPKPAPVVRQHSMPVESVQLPQQSTSQLPQRAQTLPNKPDKSARQSTIRCLIRNQLEAVFSDYEQPVSEGGGAGASAAGAGADDYASFGMNTLRGIMKEEFEKYRREMEGGGGGAAMAEGGLSETTRYSGDYEDPYETLASLPSMPPAATPPTVQAPPLPPRNVPAQQQRELQFVPGKTSVAVKSSTSYSSLQVDRPRANPVKRSDSLPQNTPQSINTEKKFVSGLVQLRAQPLPSMALQESIHKLAKLIGNDWKKLAKELPLEKSAARIDSRIKAIEKQYMGDVESQAKAALTEWRVNEGQAADVDALIIALRKCKLYKMISEVEKVTAEFTA